MPDSKLKRFWRYLVQMFKTMMLAYVLGISNVINQETRLIEDSKTKIEYHDETHDEGQIEDVD